MKIARSVVIGGMDVSLLRGRVHVAAGFVVSCCRFVPIPTLKNNCWITDSSCYLYFYQICGGVYLLTQHLRRNSNLALESVLISGPITLISRVVVALVLRPLLVLLKGVVLLLPLEGLPLLMETDPLLKPCMILLTKFTLLLPGVDVLKVSFVDYVNTLPMPFSIFQFYSQTFGRRSLIT